jgi:hypothetical protein
MPLPKMNLRALQRANRPLQMNGIIITRTIKIAEKLSAKTKQYKRLF